MKIASHKNNASYSYQRTIIKKIARSSAALHIPLRLAHPKNSAINTKAHSQRPSFIALLFGYAAIAAARKSFPFLFFSVFVFSFFKMFFAESKINEKRNGIGTPLVRKGGTIIRTLPFHACLWAIDFLMKVSFKLHYHLLYSSKPNNNIWVIATPR